MRVMTREVLIRFILNNAIMMCMCMVLTLIYSYFISVHEYTAMHWMLIFAMMYVVFSVVTLVCNIVIMVRALHTKDKT